MNTAQSLVSSDIEILEINLDCVKLSRVQLISTPIGILDVRETGELAVNNSGFVYLIAKHADDPDREFGFEQLVVNHRSMGFHDDDYWRRVADAFTASVKVLDARSILLAARRAWAALDRLRARRDYEKMHDE